MNEKFTEGEWEVANGLLVGEQVLFVHAFGKQVICRLTKQVDTTPLTEEDVANAHLIASSKKMYKMLEMLSYSVDNKIYKQDIEKLLKEARGE